MVLGDFRVSKEPKSEMQNSQKQKQKPRALQSEPAIQDAEAISQGSILQIPLLKPGTLSSGTPT